MSTLTYLKYSSGNGFGEERPLETGQKYGVLKDMERNVSGYKALRNEKLSLRAFYFTDYVWVNFLIIVLLRNFECHRNNLL